MSVFNRKKEEAKPCCCSGSAAVRSDAAAKQITAIKVLGAGCKACHQMYENTKQAVSHAGLDVEVEYITDMEQVMQYGVMSMPALVINEKVVSVGKVLQPKEVAKLLG